MAAPPSRDSVQQTICEPEDTELGENGRGVERLALKIEDDKLNTIKDKLLPKVWKKDNPSVPPEGWKASESLTVKMKLVHWS